MVLYSVTVVCVAACVANWSARSDLYVLLAKIFPRGWAGMNVFAHIRRCSCLHGMIKQNAEACCILGTPTL
jgi:hypothetical protein